MRKVPGPKPGTLIEYVPAALDNKASSEPVRVFVKAPSEGDRRNYLAELAEVVSFRPDAGGEVKIKFGDIIARKARQVARFVERVEDYDDAGGRPIATGERFASDGELALVSDVADFIDSLLTLSEVERKNSEGLSALPQAATPPPDGTAVVAKPQSSTSSETATALPATASSM